MQYHEKRKEGIEMDVKAITPLNILTSWRLNYEIPIREEPAEKM